VPRYDLPYTLGTASKSANMFTTLVDRGLANEPKGGGSLTAARTNYGVTPYMSHPFTTTFKIVKKRKMNMEAGQYIRYAFTGRRRAFIRMDRYYDATATINQLNGEKRLYKMLFYRCYGAPVNSAAKVDDVNTCQVGVDWTMIEQVEVCWNIFQNYKQYYFNNGPGSFPALVVPTTMSAAAGVAVPVGVA